MRNTLFVQRWYTSRQQDPVHIDCIITVMLKMLDGKCKMSESGKQVMEILYDCLQSQPGKLLGAAEHTLIAEARAGKPDEQARMRIYEQRLLAETMISRPVMKAFKAMLRAEGVIGSGAAV